MPSISEPFTLTELPHLSGKNKGEEKRVSLTNDKKSAFVGISSSSIASYNLLPTPQLTWSHSVSPITKITAIHQRPDAVYFGSFERKKHLLHRVAVNRTSDGTDPKEQTCIEVPSEICGLHSSNDGNLVYAVFKNSEIKCYDPETAQEIWTSKVKASRTVVFNSFQLSSAAESTAYDQDGYEDNSGPNDGFVVTVSSRDVGRKAVFEVRLYGLNGNTSQEILNKEIEIKDGEYKTGVFGYDNGLLYRYIPALHSIQVYSLTDMNLVTTVDLPSPEKESDPHGHSLITIGGGKVLLSTGYLVLLVDTKYHSILDQQELDNHFELLSYVNGSGIALGLSTIMNKSLNASVIGLVVDCGKGTVLESLTKGVQPVESQYKLGLSDVVIKKSYPVKEYNTVLKDIITTSQTQISDVLDHLDSLKEKSDVQTFEQHLIRYLKNEDLENITAKATPPSSNNNNNNNNAYVYEADKDREADKDFIFEVVMMIFHDDEKTGKLSLSPNFVPEQALIYLLTHPLFPTPELPGVLLDALLSYPRLFRQAIVTAPTLDCLDLVRVLPSPDDEIFKDIVSRIGEEFGQENISECIKLEFGKGNSKDTTRIVNCVKRLTRLNIGWPIISCFLDAGGLFAWEQSVVSELYNEVDEQVKALEQGSETMILIDEVLRKFNPETDANEVSKTSKRELKKLSKSNNKTSGKHKNSNKPEIITAENRRDEETQMQGLLQLGVQSSTAASKKSSSATKEEKQKALLRHANSISKRVPKYTVEKLVL